MGTARPKKQNQDNLSAIDRKPPGRTKSEMKKDLNIKIHEITRVEGHGNICIDVKNGRVKELKLEIIESPRFFEVMVKGRRYDEAHHIMSRICGICAVSHTSASLKAVESAMGIRISKRSALLRKLAYCGELLQSHILHIFFLVFPDLVGACSITELFESQPKLASTGLALKRSANSICEAVSGRHIHPISLAPGGVLFTPSAEDLKNVKKELAGAFDGLDRALDFILSASAPEFSMEREFISLKEKGEYGLYSGVPFSSRIKAIKPESYTKKIKEYIVPYSSAKHARSTEGTFMVGALARVNNNFRQLNARGKKAAFVAGLKPPSYNPFMNNVAQIVECFQAAEDAIKTIDALLELAPGMESPKRPTTFGTGIGIVEAPRGLLYHEYDIDRDGVIQRAECMIPTAQNLRSIEADLRAFVPSIIDRPRDDIRRSVETLMRAYDPCISCSAHIMDVSFD